MPRREGRWQTGDACVLDAACVLQRRSRWARATPTRRKVRISRSPCFRSACWSEGPMLAFCFRLSAISLALSLAPWAWGSGGGAAGKAGSQRCTQIGELTLNLLRTREPMYVQALHMQIHDQPLKRVHAACERRTEAGSTSVFLCSRGCSSAHLGGGLGHVANIFHRLPRLALGRGGDRGVGAPPGGGRGGQRRLGASQRARRRRRCAQAVMARLVLCVPKP